MPQAGRWGACALSVPLQQGQRLHTEERRGAGRDDEPEGNQIALPMGPNPVGDTLEQVFAIFKGLGQSASLEQ